MNSLYSGVPNVRNPCKLSSSFNDDAITPADISEELFPQIGARRFHGSVIRVIVIIGACIVAH